MDVVGVRKIKNSLSRYQRRQLTRKREPPLPVAFAKKCWRKPPTVMSLRTFR